MFEELSQRFEDAVKSLKGQASITETNVQGALKQVRRALLEADVSLPVVEDFVEEVRRKAVGAEVVRGVSPDQKFIQLVHQQLVDTMGGDRLRHSGYTNAQYRSLAAQIAQWKVLYGIESSSVVTHQEVDRSGSRRDPRSFNWNQLGQGLRSLWLACGGSPLNADLERSGVQTQGR